MGVTIHYAVGIRTGRVKSVLDRTEGLAKAMQTQAVPLGIAFEIRRESNPCLLVDIGNCETLAFDFRTFEYWKSESKARPWCDDTVLLQYFAKKVLDDSNSEHLKRWPDQRLLWASSFCKTQFAGSLIEHKMVADLVRSVTAYADYAHVDDEGDYYHTGMLEDAAEAIEENGKLIDSIGGMFANMGYEAIKGGDTTIKPRKTRKTV